MGWDIEETAARQGGVVIMSQIARAGFRWRDWAEYADSAGWTKVRRGAYLLPGRPLTDVARMWAEQLYHPALLASHEMGAFLLGWAGAQPCMQGSAPQSSGFSFPGRLYRAKVAGWTQVDGLRVTAPLTTACDVLRVLPSVRSVPIVDSALRSGAVALDALAASLEQAQGARGIPRAWASYSLLDPLSESPLESRTRLVLRDAGIESRSQVWFVVGVRRVRADHVVGVLRDGRQTRDLRRAEALLLIEGEGRRYHARDDGTPDDDGSRLRAFNDDVDRFNALAGLPQGVSAMRATWDLVTERPAQLRAMAAARVRALAQALREGMPPLRLRETHRGLVVATAAGAAIRELGA